MYYFLGTLISITYFNVYHPISLSSLGIFLVYYFIKSLKGFKIDKFIWVFIIFHILAGVLYWNTFDFFTMTLYSIIVFAFSLVARFDKNIYEKYSIAIVLMNYINTIVLLFSPTSRTRYKMIGNISIQINYFEDIHFSIAALTALLAIILVFKINKSGIIGALLKLTTILTSLYIIFTLGKLSTLLGLLVAVFITKLFFFKGKNYKITKLIVNLILIATFFSGWILSFIVEYTAKWNINFDLLTGRRNLIWNVYINYFSEQSFGKKFLGSFFIRTYNDIVQLGFSHPHNQWITILISTGIIGLMIYLILLNKAYDYVIKSEDKVGFAYLLALNIYATTDDYVLLTAGCVNAFLIFYFACQNKSKNKSEKLKNSI